MDNAAAAVPQLWTHFWVLISDLSIHLSDLWDHKNCSGSEYHPAAELNLGATDTGFYGAQYNNEITKINHHAKVQATTAHIDVITKQLWDRFM